MTRQNPLRIYPIGGAWGGSAHIRLEGVCDPFRSGVAMIVIAADNAEILEHSNVSKSKARGA
jgi:hypothetical protein